MNAEPTISDMMEAYALDAVDLARANFRQELDFSNPSIEAVETILGTYHETIPRSFFARLFKKPPPPERLEQVCKMFGAYIGEVIRRSFGGEWELDAKSSPGTRMIALQQNGARIWPTAKVYKRIVNGPDDNVWFYFRVITENWSAPGSGQKS